MTPFNYLLQRSQEKTLTADNTVSPTVTGTVRESALASWNRQSIKSSVNGS